MRRTPALRRAATLAIIGVVGAVAVSGCGAKKTEITVAPKGEYVALGDSYSAAPNVSARQADDSNCQRSTNNYPNLIARQLRISSFVDRTCGGAQTKDMASSQRDGVPPQFASLTKHTLLVTIGIGGNDFKLAGTLMVVCPSLRKSDPTGSPCADAAAKQGDSADVTAMMTKLTARVSAVLQALHKRAPKARVVFVGYPQSYPTTGNCSGTRLADGDVKYAYQLTSQANDAIKAAVAENHDTFIDMWTASAGHDMCSSDPWVNGASYDGAAPFHPRESEQQAVAKLVENAIGNHFPPKAPSTRA